VYTNNLFRASFAFHNLAHHDEIVAIVPEFDRPISSFDTQHVPHIIEAGERAAEEHLPYLRRLFSTSGA
jgi:NTE family protein